MRSSLSRLSWRVDRLNVVVRLYPTASLILSLVFDHLVQCLSHQSADAALVKDDFDGNKHVWDLRPGNAVKLNLVSDHFGSVVSC